MNTEEGKTYTLAHLIEAIGALPCLTSKRRAELQSAVRGVAQLLAEDPAHLALDIPMIQQHLAQVNAVRARITRKRMSNIRWGFMAAVRRSGLVPGVLGGLRKELLPSWQAFFGNFDQKRFKIGLSRLAHFASENGIAPSEVDDAVIARFRAWVHNASLCDLQARLHRQTTSVWNEAVVARPELGLTPVTVPASRQKRTRLDFSAYPATLLEDINRYLEWCMGADLLDGRERPLSASRARSLRDLYKGAATDLVASGIAASDIRALEDLVSPDAFKRILNVRIAATGRHANSYTTCLAGALVQAAKEWVKVEPETLSELKRLAKKLPKPKIEMTKRNKDRLRQLDDPKTRARLLALPARLWREVGQDPPASNTTLAKAHAAIAIEILLNSPVRIQNLRALQFDRHVFLNLDGASSLELESHETKNGVAMSFEIPTSLARMMQELRDRIAPRVLGRRPVYLFETKAGMAKSSQGLRYLIKKYVQQRTGADINPHLFRHLSGKIILEAQPGAHELVKQLLGHSRITTTVAYYTGIDTQRASRQHQELLEQQRSTLGVANG